MMIVGSNLDEFFFYFMAGLKHVGTVIDLRQTATPAAIAAPKVACNL
jgi:hypothetical protein